MASDAPVRLGTRGSELAMVQAQSVAEVVTAAGYPVEIIVVETTGDRDSRPLAEIGERGLFVKELEVALLDGEIDIAVHSAKDLRHADTHGLEVGAVGPREDPRDVLCGQVFDAAPNDADASLLAPGARVATGSVRRAAALRLMLGDVEVTTIRGNVPTRLAAARDRGDDAVMLAAAGLHRLGLESAIGCYLPVERVVPEPGQGAVALQVRTGERAAECAAWNHAPTAFAVAVERGVGARLGGGCDAPLAVHVAPAGNGDDTTLPEQWTALIFAARPDASEGAIARTQIVGHDANAAIDAIVDVAEAQGLLQLLAGDSVGVPQ